MPAPLVGCTVRAAEMGVSGQAAADSAWTGLGVPLQVQKVYYSTAGQYPTSVGSVEQALINAGISMVACFTPTYPFVSSEPAALIATVNMFTAAYATAGAGGSVVAAVLFQEPNGASTVSASQYLNIAGNFQAIRAVVPLWIDLSGGFESTQASYWDASLHDGIGVDMYAGAFNSGNTLNTADALARAAGCPLAMLEFGSHPDSSATSKFTALMAHFTSVFSARKADGQPAGPALWYNGGHGAPNPNTITSGSDSRIPYINAFYTLLTHGSTGGTGPYDVCSGGAGSGSSTLTLTVGSGALGAPGGTAAGDLAYAAISATASGNSVTSVTDSQGNTWAQANPGYGAGSSQDHWAWASLTARALTAVDATQGIAGDTVTFHFALSTGNKSAIVRGCPGVTSATPDKAVAANGSGTAPGSGSSGTLTQASELVIGAIANPSGGGTPSGLSFGAGETVTQGNMLTLFDSTVAATTAVSAGGTIASANWSASVTTFPLGTPVVPPPPLTVLTGSLPPASSGIPYLAVLAATGGVPPYTWSVTSGSLPAGLSLAATTGLISGTPGALGTSSFTAEVTDSASATATAALSVTVGATPAAYPQVIIDLAAALNLGGSWQDVSSYVYQRDSQPVRITRGRPNESAQATPSSAAGQFNNRDGSFTAANPLGQWYGLIGRNTPLRFSVPASSTFLRLEDDSASSAWCPAAPSLDITGSIDVRVDMSPSGYSPAVLAAVRGAWSLALNGDGTVTFTWTDSGSTAHSATSDQPVPLGRVMIRATMLASNGTVTFFTAPTMSGTMTQLGDAVPGPGSTSIASAAADLAFGNYGPDAPASGPGMTGRIYQARLYSGIGGTLVACPVFTAAAEGVTGFTDGQGNPWTLNGTAEISARSYRFHGELSSSPKATEPSQHDVWVPFTAGGPLRRLQQGNAPLYSPLRRALQAQPGTLACHAYWPMEDLQGSTAAGSATGGPLMISSGGTGDGSVTSSGPAWAADSTFACSNPLPTMNGAVLHGEVPGYASFGSLIVRFLLNSQSPPPNLARIMRVITTGSCTEWSLYYGTGGALGVAGYNASGTVFDSGLAAFGIDSNPVWVSMELRPGSGSTVNWSLATLQPGASAGLGISGTFSGLIGNATSVLPSPQGLLGEVTIGHASVQSGWESLFTLWQPLNAWQGETAANRFARLCAENGFQSRIWGYPDVSAAMGAQPVDTLPTLLQQCETADRGQIYEPRQALALAYRTLAGLENQAAAITLDWSQAHLAAANFQPATDDDQYTVNDVTATRTAGGSAGTSGATYRITLDDGSPMSISTPPDGVGDYATTASLNLQGDPQLADAAGWILHCGTVGESRYPAIPVDLARAATAALFYELQEVDAGDYVQVVNPPSWLAPDDIRQLAAGVTEEVGGYIWRITWNGIPERPYETAVLDDLVHGRADTDGSVLDTPIGTGDTTMLVDTTGPSGIPWTTAVADFPFDIGMGGERITVTAISGTSSPQAFTVTRSVNGVVKAHQAGEAVSLFCAPVLAIA